MIAGYRFKTAWWLFSFSPQTPGGGIIVGVLIGAAAVAALVGSWRERPWGYVLVLLLATLENLLTIFEHFALEANPRIEDLLSIALSGLPLFAAILAAALLLQEHYTGEGTAEQATTGNAGESSLPSATPEARHP